jgi:hypothetical protein
MEDFSGLSSNTWSSANGDWYFQSQKLNVEQISSGKMAYAETIFYPYDLFTLDVDVEKVALPQGGAYGIYPFTSGDVFLGADGKTLAGVGAIVFDSGNAYLTGWDVLGSAWYKSDKYPTTSPITSIGVAYAADAVTLRINRQNTSLKLSGDFSFSYWAIDKLWLMAQGDGTHMRFDNVCSDAVTASSPPPPPPPPSTYTLSVSKSGDGSGTVASSPAGISCGSGCTSAYDEGTTVTLTAAADTGSTFSGWSGGGCSGTGACVVTMNADTGVTAAFSKTSTPIQVPQNLRYTLNGNMITINWDPAAGAAGYRIGLGTAASGSYEQIFDVGNILQVGPMDVSGYAPGTYYVAVKAYSSTQESGYSNEITVTKDDPFAPQPVFPGTTTPEAQSATTSTSQSTQVTLSDGSSVTFPATSEPMNFTFERQSNTLEFNSNELESLQKSAAAASSEGEYEFTGSMRVVTLPSEGLPADFALHFVLPAREYGEINPDTINIYRESACLDGSQQIRRTLSSVRAPNGDIFFSDPYLSWDAISHNISEVACIRSSKYVYMTFQRSLNWHNKPSLVRMAINPTGNRVPLSTLSADEQDKELKKCSQNVVVLVHGHNEAEKAGFSNAEVEAPWLFSYKKDMWNYMYKELNNLPDSNALCTVFYEYIYPSYRPVFAGEGNTGDDLAEQLEDVFQPLFDKNIDPKLFIVTHSQGGLVARAAVQKFSPALHKAFQKMVSWGTPHHGSVISSFRYAFEGPYEGIPSNSFWNPLGIGTSLVLNIDYLKRYMLTQQLDTLGARDLRWDGIRSLSLPDIFQLVTWGPSAALTNANDAKYNIKDGTWVYNKNLYDLNSNDYYKYADGSKANLPGNKKYTFLYGLTSKLAPLIPFNGLLLSDFCETCLGQRITRLGLPHPDEEYLPGITMASGDGASPAISMRADGIDGEYIYVGDIDHEEYYSSKLFDGGPETKGTITAERTMDALKLSDSKYSCLVIESLTPTFGRIGDTVTITGKGFGAQQLTGTVTFNGIVASAISSWSDTSIVATVPAIMATTCDVVVKLGDAWSNAVKFTVYGPTITSLSPDSGPVGTAVAITGTGFGAMQGTVTFNGIMATVTSWSDTVINTTVPSGATTGDVVVANHITAEGSNRLTFTVADSSSGNGSGNADGGYAHLSFSIIGVQNLKLLSVTGDLKKVYRYSGKLVGNKLTFTGKGWGDFPPAKPGETQTLTWKFNAGLAVAGVADDDGSNNVEYFITNDGTLPSVPFSFSSPTPTNIPGASSAIIGASLFYFTPDKEGVEVIIDLDR